MVKTIIEVVSELVTTISYHSVFTSLWVLEEKDKMGNSLSNDILLYLNAEGHSASHFDAICNLGTIDCLSLNNFRI